MRGSTFSNWPWSAKRNQARVVNQWHYVLFVQDGIFSQVLGFSKVNDCFFFISICQHSQRMRRHSALLYAHQKCSPHQKRPKVRTSPRPNFSLKTLPASIWFRDEVQDICNLPSTMRTIQKKQNFSSVHVDATSQTKPTKMSESRCCP